MNVTDYFTFANSLTDGAQLGSVPATVSFEVRWHGTAAAKTIGDGKNFQAEVVENEASVRWRGEERGFHFKSQSSIRRFAEIGTERNGVFL
jgi:hypothetical protein